MQILKFLRRLAYEKLLHITLSCLGHYSEHKWNKFKIW